MTEQTESQKARAIAERDAQDRARFLAEREEGDRQKANNKAARRRDLKAKEASGEFVKPAPGLVWNPASGTFVAINYISRAKFERLFLEMPTDAHRDILCARHPNYAPPKQKGRASPARLEARASQAPPPTPRAPVIEQAVDGGRKVTKSDTMVALMRRPEGATAEELGAACGWTVKSVSGRLSELRKTQAFTSSTVEGVRRYFVTEETKS